MQVTLDPWISEWGNPTLVMRGHPALNSVYQRGSVGLVGGIECGRRTRGSETSKYPEEEKETIDFLSSGERKGKSLNPNACMKAAVVVHGV